jgi:hypothetical protein
MAHTEDGKDSPKSFERAWNSYNRKTGRAMEIEDGAIDAAQASKNDPAKRQAAIDAATKRCDAAIKLAAEQYRTATGEEVERYREGGFYGIPRSPGKR